MKLASGAVLDGKYSVVRELGSGSAACVYEAEHLIVGKHVALKVLDSEFSSVREIRMSFVGEARAAAQIAHANVVDIYDLGVTDDGLTYLVMELLRGETLHAALGSRGAMAPAYACELMLQVLAGLAAAHAEGIVHRDLKPANVIITHPRSDSPLAKVLDFGIAMGVADAVDEDRMDRIMSGTPAYMAPEQILTSRVDARADIYAAGAMLFEMLTGEDAVEGRSVTEVLANALQGMHRQVCRLNPSVPAALARLVERALSLDPAERPQTAREFARQLSPFVAPDRMLSLGPALETSCAPIPLILPTTQPLLLQCPTIPGPVPQLMSAGCFLPHARPAMVPAPPDKLGDGELSSPPIPRAPATPQALGPAAPAAGEDRSAITASGHAATRQSRPRRSQGRSRRAPGALRALIAGGVGLGIGAVMGWLVPPW